ncbi:hypothetical protein CC78DRAFT_571355 [Lojkania enalia]|uniref:Uncharacterized protein n=1 Tax=Lojkania enalia TaxID=147567 RepID=A0A9P4K1F9_9PLEO|nr:hypothetical protein CC78DRAFT_571355 [Didymosphaeria enalia]
MYGSSSPGRRIVKQLVSRYSLIVALTTTDVLQCMAPARLVGASSNNPRPYSSFDDDRRPAMYGSDSLGRRIVKQLVSLWRWRQRVLLHGDVLFKVITRDPYPVIGDPFLSVRWKLCLWLGETLAIITSVRGLRMKTTQYSEPSKLCSVKAAKMVMYHSVNM